MATVTWDVHAVVAMLHNIGNSPTTLHELKLASAIAGFLVERHAKLNLTRMVYSQPMAESGYRRTGTLRRSIHTVPPGADHASDETTAKTTEMGGKQSPALVGEEGGRLVTEVGTWLRYSKHVHDGTGRYGRAQAKPYLTDALNQNRRAIEDIIARGVANALRHAMA